MIVWIVLGAVLGAAYWWERRSDRAYIENWKSEQQRMKERGKR